MHKHKGKKPKTNMKGRNRARMNEATGFNSLAGSSKPRYQIIGPGERIPRFVFKATAFFTAQTIRGDAFSTQTNLNGQGQIVGAAAPVGNAFAFAIKDIGTSDIAAYAALFDQFIITKVILRIRASGTTTTGGGGILYVVCDFDNANLLTTIPLAEDYNNVQELRTIASVGGFSDSLVVTLKPCIGVATNAGNVIIGPQWQDMAVQTNRHYGVKTFYNTTAVTDAKFDVEAQYHFGFRNRQ
jgi:hypothetical protein